jgi:phosphoribosyl-ATP pyrophosphohydrolase
MGEKFCEFVFAVNNRLEKMTVRESQDVLFHPKVALKAANADFIKMDEKLKIQRNGMHLHD